MRRDDFQKELDRVHVETVLRVAGPGFQVEVNSGGTGGLSNARNLRFDVGQAQPARVTAVVALGRKPTFGRYPLTAGRVVKERDVETVRTERFADFLVDRFAVQLDDELQRRTQSAENARKRRQGRLDLAVVDVRLYPLKTRD